MRGFIKICSMGIVPFIAAALVSGHQGKLPGHTQETEVVHSPKLRDAHAFFHIPLVSLVVPTHSPDTYCLFAQQKVRQFYWLNKLQSVWLGTEGPTPAYHTFMKVLQNCGDHGLDPCDYGVEELATATERLYASAQMDTFAATQQDIAISKAYFLYTMHLTHGRIHSPGHQHALWMRKHRPEKTILPPHPHDTSEFGKRMTMLHPRSVQYKQLQAAYTHYSKLAGAYPEGSLPVISLDKTLEPGQRHITVPSIRRRLNITDMYTDTPKDSTLYDERMLLALRAFQERHGLEPDGRIGRKTVTFLNMSFQEKTDLIALNMERLRWLMFDTNGLYIVVNIPEYTLRAFEGEREILSMRVIVGKEYQCTPVFTDSISHIVFNPPWGVPQSIIQKEMIPRLKADPEAYSGKNFKVYQDGREVNAAEVDWNYPAYYEFVQQPGASNALGLVKFVLHNDMKVYLHDTPNDYLFQRCERALSHGCIRLEKPALLAACLLRGQEEWTEKRVTGLMNSGVQKQVVLQKPVPVHIIYQTAWVDNTGRVHFRDDIYGHDQYQMMSLQHVDGHL